MALDPKPSSEAVIQLPHQSYNSDKGAFSAALEDVCCGAVRVRLWTTLAWEGFVEKYRRSYLGVMWEIISFMIFAFAILFFLGALAGPEAGSLTFYTVIGFLMFNWLSTIAVEGAQVFFVSRSWLKSAQIELSVFVFAGIMRTLIVLAFSSFGALIILLINGYQFPPGAYWAIGGVVATAVNAIWFYFFCGIVGAKFKDIIHLIQAFMRMAFFITPIMWTVQEGTARGLIAFINPMTHFMEIVRMPLLDGTVPTVSWMIVGAITAGGYLVAVFTYVAFRRRVPVWL